MRSALVYTLVALTFGCSDGATSSPGPSAKDGGAVNDGSIPVPSDGGGQGAFRKTIKVSHNGTEVDVVVDKPENDAVDVLVVFHGSVWFNAKVLESTTNILDNFKKILTRKDMMIVSVAYPEEGMLLGDNIAHAEAGLLWVKNNASSALGVTVKKVFLAGHSQGGYLVTRLNGMHETDGVIANGAGPLDLVYRCQLEESGQLESGFYCKELEAEYGTTTANPQAYTNRSLLNFTKGLKADTLFVQGLNDKAVQMHSWPTFKEQVKACTGCAQSRFLDLEGVGHAALFESAEAATTFNTFIANH